ncbi:MAG: anti-sigma factor [Actinomycetota bacterium]|nr:hypothetical protein [Actinomycetota bacterium]
MNTTEACRDFTPYLMAAPDEVDDLAAARLAEHIGTCTACRAESAQYSRLRDSLSLAGAREAEPPADLVPAVLARATRERRHVIPMLPVPQVELARVIQDNREVIAQVAGVAIVAAGAAWALWRGVRAYRTAPARG